MKHFYCNFAILQYFLFFVLLLFLLLMLVVVVITIIVNLYFIFTENVNILKAAKLRYTFAAI
jgi:hypothetical protein